MIIKNVLNKENSAKITAVGSSNFFLFTDFTQPWPSTEKTPMFTDVVKYHGVSNLPDYQKDQEQK